jgi:hypothetical protein
LSLAASSIPNWAAGQQKLRRHEDIPAGAEDESDETLDGENPDPLFPHE